MPPDARTALVQLAPREAYTETGIARRTDHLRVAACGSAEPDAAHAAILTRDLGVPRRHPRLRYRSRDVAQVRAARCQRSTLTL